MNAVTLAFDRSRQAQRPLLAKHLVRSPEFEVPEVRDDVLEMAMLAWEDRTQAEYIGVMLVRHLHGLLVDCNAPMDLQEIAIVMMLQEQQHAGLCRDAAVALGSNAEITIPLDELQIQRLHRPADELLQMAAGTFAVGEVTALGLIRHTLGVLPPSGFQEVLRRIAADEGLHARFGPLLLQSMKHDAWYAWPGDRAVHKVVTSQRQTMAARAVIEPDEAALFEDPEAAAQLPLLGIPPSQGFLAAYHHSLEVDVRRGLEPLGFWPRAPTVG